MSNKAVLKVSNDLMQQWVPLLPEPSYGVVLFGLTDDLIKHYRAFRELFRLPDGFEVVGLFYDCGTTLWYVHINSDQFPETQGGILPQIIGVWEKKDGKARLAQLSILAGTSYAPLDITWL